MSKDTPEVAAARIEAERARAQMIDTARELQERLSPATLAQTAWVGAKAKGADWAEDAVEAVRRRPAIASGIVAAVAMFLAREPLIDMAGKLADGVGNKRKARSVRKSQKKQKAQSKQKDTETIE
jgi:hypothetical protein